MFNNSNMEQFNLTMDHLWLVLTSLERKRSLLNSLPSLPQTPSCVLDITLERDWKEEEGKLASSQTKNIVLSGASRSNILALPPSLLESPPLFWIPFLWFQTRSIFLARNKTVPFNSYPCPISTLWHRISGTHPCEVPQRLILRWASQPQNCQPPPALPLGYPIPLIQTLWPRHLGQILEVLIRLSLPLLHLPLVLPVPLASLVDFVILIVVIAAWILGFSYLSPPPPPPPPLLAS